MSDSVKGKVRPRKSQQQAALLAGAPLPAAIPALDGTLLAAWRGPRP